MKMLNNSSDRFIQQMDQGLHAMSAGLGTMAVGAGVLGTLAFPLRDAINFEESIQQTFSIMNEQTPEMRKKLEDLAITLGSTLPGTAEEMSRALKSAITAGITDLDTAGFVVEFGTKLALPTDASINDTTNGIITMLNAYGLANKEIYTTEAIRANVQRMSDQILEATKIGRFSDTGQSDVGALTRQLGNVVPLAAQLNITTEELLGSLAVITTEGQNARRGITGFRQGLQDLINPNSNWGNFLEFLDEKGLRNDMAMGGVINPARFFREHGFVGEGSFTDIFSQYVGIRADQREEIASILNSDKYKNRMKAITDKIASGELDPTASIAESADTQALLEQFSSQGIIDLPRFKEIFDSVEGTIAFLPLISSQYGRLVDAVTRLENVSGVTESAFAQLEKTVKLRWEKLTSAINALNIIWGTEMLPGVANTISAVNAFVSALIKLSETFHFLIGPILTATTYIGIFLASMGAAMAASGGIKALSAFIAENAAESGMFARILGGSLTTALWRVTWLTTGLIAAQKILSYVWNSNMFNMRNRAENFQNRVVSVFNAIRELFNKENINWRTGMTKMSEATRKNLQRLGLLQFTLDLAALLFRLGKFVRGFAQGFTDTMYQFRKTFIVLINSVTDGMEKFNIFPKVREWLTSLFDPTKENVQQFRNFGVAVGRVAAGLALLLGVGAGLAIFGTVGRILFQLNGGFKGLLLDIAPLITLIGGLAGAGWLVKQAFEGNWLGFADWLESKVPRLANVIDNFEFITSGFITTLKTKGLSEALRQLTFRLTGMYPATIAQRTVAHIYALGEAINRFPRDVRLDGWRVAFENFFNTVFGEEQGKIIFTRLNNIRLGIITYVSNIVDFIRDIPMLITSGMGIDSIFGSLFSLVVPQGQFRNGMNRIITLAQEKLGALNTHFENWLRRMGWLKYWNKAKLNFAEFSARVRNIWNTLVSFIGTVWNDAKKIDWNAFVGEAVVALSSLASFVGFIFDQIIKSARSLYNSLTKTIDWAQIKALFSDLNSLITGGPQGQGAPTGQSGWSFFWDTVAESINNLVTSLRIAVNLMRTLKSLVTQDGQLGQNAAATGQGVGNLIGNIFQNPASAFGSLLLLDFIIGRFGKLFKTIKGGAGQFSLLGGAVRGTFALFKNLGRRLFNFVAFLRNWRMVTGEMRSFTQILRTTILPRISAVFGRIFGFLIRGGVGFTLLFNAIRVGFVALIGAVGWPFAVIGGIIAAGIAAWSTNLWGFRDWVQNLDLWSSIGTGFRTVMNELLTWFDSFMPKLQNKYVDLNNWLQGGQNRIIELFGGEPIPLMEYVDVPSAPASKAQIPSGPSPVTLPKFNPNTAAFRIPTTMQATRGVEPEVVLEGANAEQLASLKESLMPLYNAFRTDTSSSGEKVDVAELSILNETLDRLVGILNDGITATSPALIIDGYNLNKATNTANRRLGQRKGGSGGGGR